MDKLEKNTYKGFYEQWLMEISPLALTLLIRNLQDPQDRSKTEKIANMLCKNGANINENLKPRRVNFDSKRTINLDDIDQHKIIEQIRSNFKAKI